MTTVPCRVLEEMYAAGPVPLRPAYAEALYQLTRRARPSVCLEIGCAMGSSTLAICTALRENGAGKLISIDPFQSTTWKDAGRAAVARAGLSAYHEVIEEMDYFALPRLLSEGLAVDLAYIDGMHTFDYTLMDIFYVAKLVRQDGVVGFNDCGWRAVHRVLRWLLTHRHFEELDVGLEPDYAGRVPLASAALKRVQGRPNNDRYFRKLDEFEPKSQFYARF